MGDAFSLIFQFQKVTYFINTIGIELLIFLSVIVNNDKVIL